MSKTQALRASLRLHTTRIFGLSVVSDTFSKIFELLTTHNAKPLLVATPNPEQVVLSCDSASFKKTLQAMDVLLPDGIGLVLAAQLLAAAGKSLPIANRITGVDVVKALLIEASESGKKVLVIGGQDYERYTSSALQFKDGSALTLDIAAVQGSSVCYWMQGYADKVAPTQAEEQKIAQVLAKLKPEYVFVALGAPYQEHWLLAHESILQQNKVRVAMAVGGAFDMLTGKLPRAPQALRTFHLEWLYRLWQEPWRWRRQLKLMRFIKLTVQEVLHD